MLRLPHPIWAQCSGIPTSRKEQEGEAYVSECVKERGRELSLVLQFCMMLVFGASCCHWAGSTRGLFVWKPGYLGHGGLDLVLSMGFYFVFGELMFYPYYYPFCKEKLDVALNNYGIAIRIHLPQSHSYHGGRLPRSQHPGSRVPGSLPLHKALACSSASP